MSLRREILPIDFITAYRYTENESWDCRFISAGLVWKRARGREMTAIHYENLTVRQAVAADAKQLTAWWNDGAVMAHAGFPNGLGTTEEEVIGGLGGGRMVIAEGGRLIGECSYRDIADGAAEIGIKICETDCQNRGVGRKVLSMLIDRLFRSGYSKIVLDTNLANTRAQHVYESLGFRKVRTKMDSWKDQLGRLQSSIDYELVERDFVSYLNQVIRIDESLRLRRFDGVYDFAFQWYQDPETVLLVDGKAEPYSRETLDSMYRCLDSRGELYFIEIHENGGWKPIGDITFWQEDMPIVIGAKEYRGKGIGRKVVKALVERGRALGYERLYVREIYDFNVGSQRCFESAGFRRCEKTEKGYRYVLTLKDPF